MGRVTVVGLGPAGPDLLTAQTAALLASVPVKFLRTARHPAAAAVPDATSFDDAYERAESFDEVYRTIVDTLAEAAGTHGHVLYAVPGSPAVAERSVELLRADERVDVDVVPALSCLDLIWARLGVDPLATGVRIVDGRRFAAEAAGERGPILVLQCDQRQVLSDVKLAIDDSADGAADSAADGTVDGAVDGPPPVIVLQRLGLPDERIVEVGWNELDRAVEPDHLTSLWIPQLAAPVGFELVRFAELVRTLRERCPWDREQTHQTLTRHLLEETYEVLEAVEGLDAEGGFAHLEEELGDLLFQVYFHATLAAEEGQFTLADVARGIHDKLVRRHPHVFGSVTADTADEVVSNWEQIKRSEKGRTSIMDGIPGALPSLLYAHKVQRKAASVGFDWDDVAGAYPKVLEELEEVRVAAARATEVGEGSEAVNGGGGGGEATDAAVADEVGDLLFACVNVARHLGVDPEAALRAATAKFRDRFMAVEALAARRGVDLVGADLATLDRLWDEVKASAR